MRLLFLISLIYLVKNAYSAEIRIDPLVKIDQGLIRGIKSVEDGYSSFLGIPYAQVDLDNPFGVSPCSFFLNIQNILFLIKITEILSAVIYKHVSFSSNHCHIPDSRKKFIMLTMVP